MTAKIRRRHPLGCLLVMVMMALVVLPSLGMVSSSSRLSTWNEYETQAEEIQEKLASSADHRVRCRRVLRKSDSEVFLPVANSPNRVAAVGPPPVVGHRIANGLLAPIRC